MPITVKWGRDRISFDLPHPDTPLSAVRASLAEYTHLPHDGFKLIHAGALMKDDNAPISAYRLHPNSTIALIPTNQPLPPHPAPAAPPLPASEPAIVHTIHAELARVRTDLVHPLAQLLDALATPNPPSREQQKEHSRLGELLLQSLLRLDGISTQHDWEDARRERKEAVREVQGLLDRLDAAWAARPRS